MFAGTRMKHLLSAPLYGNILALLTNIKLSWKILRTNTSLLRKCENYGRKNWPQALSVLWLLA